MIRQVGKRKTAKKARKKEVKTGFIIVFLTLSVFRKIFLQKRHLTAIFLLLLGPLTKVPTISIKKWVDLEVTDRDSMTTQWSQLYRKEAFSFR